MVRATIILPLRAQAPAVSIISKAQPLQDFRAGPKLLAGFEISSTRNYQR
jgi:hypothetical protein